MKFIIYTLVFTDETRTVMALSGSGLAGRQYTRELFLCCAWRTEKCASYHMMNDYLRMNDYVRMDMFGSVNAGSMRFDPFTAIIIVGRALP